jgi:hypothetical protein
MKSSRLGPRDPKRPSGVTGDPHAVRSEQENMEGDEDGVGQVEGDLGGRPDTHLHRGSRVEATRSQVWWFGPQNHQGGRFLGLGLKTEVGARRGRAARRTRGVTWRRWFRWFGPQNRHGGGFPGFGLKTGVRAQRDRVTRRTHGARAVVAWRRGKDANRSRPSDGKKKKN